MAGRKHDRIPSLPSSYQTCSGDREWCGRGTFTIHTRFSYIYPDQQSRSVGRDYNLKPVLQEMSDARK